MLRNYTTEHNPKEREKKLLGKLRLSSYPTKSKIFDENRRMLSDCYEIEATVITLNYMPLDHLLSNDGPMKKILRLFDKLQVLFTFKINVSSSVAEYD